MLRGSETRRVQSEFTARSPDWMPVPTTGRVMPATTGPMPRPSFQRMLALGCLAVGCLLPGEAMLAQGREDGPHARLPESVRRIERETGGKVLQVRPIRRGERELYRMKVLTPDGRVRIVQDDPRWPRTKDPDRQDRPPSRPPAAEDSGRPPPDPF
ncbi:MAG: hypothetical protein KatS3mg126_0840 [Lysobacteraceae bacterium]|nr:MAG: hypothetical protein KatS3mg126_0840 [Xanthomonadaceae bacterium]